jgi:8-oxo-dGTP pyrophosphatase MutT (NUDIX family)
MVSSVLSLEDIRRELAAHEPRSVGETGGPRAAVALILHETGSGLELLFIERARCPGDPWSGHMAFPGGRVDPGDPSSRAAAERETREEVGLSLDSTDYLGHLNDLEGRPDHDPKGIVISAYIYHVLEPETPVPNAEVETAFWFPIEDLFDPDRHVEHWYSAAGEMPFPGILVGEPGRHVVWGLTYRFLDMFLAAVGRPLPDRWAPFRGFRGNS